MFEKTNWVPILLACCCHGIALSAPPRQVMLFIGDGMGFEQVRAAGMYAHGEANTLSFESFPYKGQVTTNAAFFPITDSAAAATAMATGRKVLPGVVSLAIPGDFSELETLLERAKEQGKSVGLVTTTIIAHATPACFGAHELTRDNYIDIVADYLTQTRPDVLFGGAEYISSLAASLAGYVVVTDHASMYALDTNSLDHVSGQFGSGNLPFEYDGLGMLPHLSEMTATAIDILDNEANGFFLMVEGGRIDHAGHDNDIQRSVLETVEFANAVQEAVDWAEGRADTLILVTADHETGGLTVVANNGQGQFPTVAWFTTYHTAFNVPVYAWGANANLVSGVLDNTDIFLVASVNQVGFPDYDWDTDVDFVDFAHFALEWSSGDCVFPYYCEGADLNLSGMVDAKDLQLFAHHWLAR
jgi:alkaline phosphatase